ncbi:MAG: GAF domain-containing protein, partial [Myxococcota bacterium]
MMQIEQNKLVEVIESGLQLAQVRDLDVLLERVLESARRFVNADAGSIYVREGENLKFSHAQNETLRRRLGPRRKLMYTTFSVPINNRSIAGQVAQSGEALNIPDVYELPAGSTYAFDPAYDRLTSFRTRSVLAVPLKTHRGGVIGVLQLINAFDSDGVTVVPFNPGIVPFIQHFANNAASAIERAALVRGTILRMIKMAELRDPKETGSHVNRVGGYAVEIYEAWARKRGTDEAIVESTRDVLRMAGMLHDVGKVAISDTILKK